MRIEGGVLMACAAMLGACASAPTPDCMDGLRMPVVAHDATTEEGPRKATLLQRQWDLARAGDPAAQTAVARTLEQASRVGAEPAIAACLYKGAARDVAPYTTVYMPAAGKLPAQTMLLPNAEARPGDPEAMFRLGLMLRDGRGGLEQSATEARRWIARAAERGHAAAIKLLARDARRF